MNSFCLHAKLYVEFGEFDSKLKKSLNFISFKDRFKEFRRNNFIGIFNVKLDDNSK